jgi:hypothetical protein
MSGEGAPAAVRTAREAAIEAALGEWVQLVDRAEALKDELRAVDAALQSDLHSLGELVARMETAAEEHTAQAASAALIPQAPLDIEVITRAVRDGASEALTAIKPPPMPRVSNGLPWSQLVLVALLAGGAGAGASYYLSADVEAAHAGRALLKAWPRLDNPTKQKVEEAMRR